MTPAVEKKLAALRCGLRYASRAHRPAIQALIDALLAEQDKPATGGARASEGCLAPPARRLDAERAAHPPVAAEIPEGRSGTAREAPSTGMRDGTAPPAVHTPAEAAVGVQPAAPFSRPAPQTTAPATAADDQPPRCPSCGRGFERRDRRQRYCSRKCQNRRPGRLEASRRYAARSQQRRRGAKAGAAGAPPLCARTGCGRPIPAERLQWKTTRYCSAACATAVAKGGWREREAAAAVEHPYARQAAPQRTWRLEWHPEVKIRPPLPAPLRRYSDGRPTPFQDDLNAIRDHGSPGPLAAPPVGQARQSILA